MVFKQWFTICNTWFIKYNAPLYSDKPSINLFNAKDSQNNTSEIDEITITMKNVKFINSNFN